MNRKGAVSEFLAVVLLIGIATILSIGIYFWVAGYTKEAAPTAPRIIQVTASCGASGGTTTIRVIHASTAGATTITPSTDLLYMLPGGAGGTPALNTCNPDSIAADGGQTSCTISGFGIGDGSMLIMPASGKNIASAMIEC